MMTASTDAGIAFFDIFDPAFRIDSPAVRAAADACWWGRTSIGLAVLRYRECLMLLRDHRLRHGGLDALAAYGVTEGLFVDWLRASLLNVEGQPHQRRRRLVSKAFTQRSADGLRPFMRAKAHQLIDGFTGTGSCEFMTAFADPYPAWVIAELLGIPAERFDAFLGWATDIGLGYSPSAEPDTFGDAPFDITAQRTAQLTLGGGIHYCLGAWLARIEMREALPILATRLGHIALDGPVASRPHVGITGPITLPLRFTGSLR